MKHARITITSPDRPTRYLDITDTGYSIEARWVPLDSSVRDTPPMDTIMTYKHSVASTDLVYATVAALLDSLPATMHLPIAATDSMPSKIASCASDRTSPCGACAHADRSPNCPF